MNTAILVLLSVVLLGLIICLFLFKNLFKKIGFYETELNQYIEGANNRNIENWREIINKTTNCENKINQYLEGTSNRNIENWREIISKTTNSENKLRLLEAAAKRYPSQKDFIISIRDILDPFAKDDENLLVRREALIRLREHADRFAENCEIEDFDYACSFNDDIVVSMESVIKKIDDLRKTNLENIILDLKNKITLLEKKPKNTKLLEEIERIDKNIEHSILNNYPKLKMNMNNYRMN